MLHSHPFLFHFRLSSFKCFTGANWWIILLLSYAGAAKQRNKKQMQKNFGHLKRTISFYAKKRRKHAEQSRWMTDSSINRIECIPQSNQKQQQQIMIENNFYFHSDEKKIEERKTSFLAFSEYLAVCCDMRAICMRRISLFSDFIRLANRYTKGWSQTQPNCSRFLDSIQSIFLIWCGAIYKMFDHFLRIRVGPFVYYLNGPNLCIRTSKVKLELDSK